MGVAGRTLKRSGRRACVKDARGKYPAASGRAGGRRPSLAAVGVGGPCLGRGGGALWPACCGSFGGVRLAGRCGDWCWFARPRCGVRTLVAVGRALCPGWRRPCLLEGLVAGGSGGSWVWSVVLWVVVGAGLRGRGAVAGSRIFGRRGGAGLKAPEAVRMGEHRCSGLARRAVASGFSAPDSGPWLGSLVRASAAEAPRAACGPTCGRGWPVVCGGVSACERVAGWENSNLGRSVSIGCVRRRGSLGGGRGCFAAIAPSGPGRVWVEQGCLGASKP